MTIFQEYDTQIDIDDQDDYMEWDYSTCPHGIYKGLVGGYCKACEYEEKRGGIDKCMNCGKYKYNDELNYSPQVCKKGCRNPNEY